jgi:hypothetical protein
VLIVWVMRPPPAMELEVDRMKRVGFSEAHMVIAFFANTSECNCGNCQDAKSKLAPAFLQARATRTESTAADCHGGHVPADYGQFVCRRLRQRTP